MVFLVKIGPSKSGQIDFTGLKRAVYPVFVQVPQLIFGIACVEPEIGPFFVIVSRQFLDHCQMTDIRSGNLLLLLSTQSPQTQHFNLQLFIAHVWPMVEDV